MSPFSYLRRLDTGFVRRIFLLAVAVVFATACGGKAKEGVLPPGSRVLALGDSLTAGAGVAPAEAWLQQRRGPRCWRIVRDGL
jgi:hypothetical protein